MNKVVGIVVLILAVGGIVAAGVYLVDEAEPTPAEAFVRSIEAIGEQDTLSLSANYTVAATATDAFSGIEVRVDADVSGDMKAEWKDNFLGANMEGSLKINKFDARQQGVTFELGSGEISYAILDDMAYLQFTTVPETLLAFVPSAAQIEGKWVEIDMREIMQEAGIDEEELTGQALSPLSLEEHELEQLASIISEHEMFTFETLPDEEIDGVDTYHYKVTLSEENFVQGLRAMRQEVIENREDASTELTKEEVDEIFAELEEALARFDYEELPFEIWVEKDSFRMRKFRWAGDLASVSATEINPQLESIEGQFSLVVEMSDYGEPVNIIAPAGAVSVEEFEQMLLGPAFAPTQ